MNFLVVCRDEPFGFETLVNEAEVRSVPTLDRFKGRKLKAADTCERAVVVINDALVASGWFASPEWETLKTRQEAGEVKVLAIRIGLAPCVLPQRVLLVDEADARTALRRFLANQPLQLPRPRTVAESEEQHVWADLVAQANLGGDIPLLMKDLGLSEDSLAPGRIVASRFRLIADLGPDALFANWYAHDLVGGTAALFRIAHPHEQARAALIEPTLAIWDGLSHPAIARLLDQGRRSGSLWMANEIIDEPLATLVEQSEIDGDRILLAVLEVADALAYAHSEGVVHGAVDPKRIWVGRDGSTRLSDFGVAAITRGSRDGVVFAAPETLAPDATPEVGNDVYGVAMLMLLGLHGSALPYWVLRDANRLITELALSDELHTTITAALDWNPAQRPSSVDALSHALLSDAPLAVRLANRALQYKRLAMVERIVNQLDTQDQVPSEVSRLRMATARVRAAEGEPSEAIATLSALADGADDAAGIWLEIASIQQDNDDAAGAVQSCEAALEQHQNREQAITALRMLLDLDPDRFARWGRTLALYTDGNEKGEVSWRLGKVFHDAGDDSSALLWLDRAAAAGHEHADLSTLRKKIRAARGDWTEVVRMMVERAAETEDPTQAIEDLEKAARIARRATTNPQPLTAIHARILELDPNHISSLQHLIREATREGAIEEVLRLQGLVCGSATAEPGDHAAHARKLLAAGRHEDALAAADRALAVEPDHIVALRVAGRAAQDGGQFERASAHRVRLLVLQSTGASSAQADRLAHLGDLRRFAGDSTGAADYYDQAITISPNHLGAWWGLYVIERSALEDDGSIPAAPLRFGPHESLARLFADLLTPESIDNALELDPFGAALLSQGEQRWQACAAVVDLLTYREAIGPQLFDRLLDAFPQRIAEITTVQGMWSGAAHHSGTFPIAEAVGWSDDGPDFGTNLHRELLFCASWPAESALLNPRLFDLLFQRDDELIPRPRATDDDDDEDLLLESPEVPVLLIGLGENQRQLEVETNLTLDPKNLPFLPGTLSVHRHGDQIYLSVDRGTLVKDTRSTTEVRLTGGDKLVWEGVPIEFYRVQDPTTLSAPSALETTAKLPQDREIIPGSLKPVEMAALDPDEPCLVWGTETGEIGIQLDHEQLMVVARADGSLLFTTEPSESYLAVIMNRGGDCYLEENLSHDSGFGGRLSARALIPGESLRFGSRTVIFRAPGKGLPGLVMPEPTVTQRKPYLVLMDGSQNGRPIAINHTPFRLGRGRDCELQIRTDGLLSRVHCVIEHRDTGHTLRDAGSSNGTRLNGRTVPNQAVPLQENDRIEIGHTMLVFTHTVVDEDLPEKDEITEETMDQEGVATRTWMEDAVPTVAFDDDSPEVQRKVAVANRALAVLAAALDGNEGAGRTRAELQLIIDAGPREFQGLFDGLELSSHALPWDLIDDALADRPERRRIQALSSGLLALVDKMTDRVCELLPPDSVEAVLADIAVIGHRRELHF